MKLKIVLVFAPEMLAASWGLIQQIEERARCSGKFRRKNS